VISLTRLNGTPFWVNAELIEQVEKAPDTIITLTTGNNIIVREAVETVIQKCVEYRQSVAAARETKTIWT
jgi:flagellar protein FlbD